MKEVPYSVSIYHQKPNIVKKQRRVKYKTNENRGHMKNITKNLGV